MTLDPSTITLLVLVSGLVGAALGALLVPRLLRPRPGSYDAYLNQHAVRFACAQHWARGGVLSGADEPWRPVCTALAIAALVAEDDADLVQLVSRATGAAGADAELANVWRQARAELLGQRERLQFTFLAGVRDNGAPDWNYAALRERADQVLEAAQRGAAAALAARRRPVANS